MVLDGVGCHNNFGIRYLGTLVPLALGTLAFVSLVFPPAKNLPCFPQSEQNLLDFDIYSRQ